MNNYIAILGMVVVTYIPRYIPFIISETYEFPASLRKILSYIPITALGALILPDALGSIPESRGASIIGLVIAIILSYIQKNIFITVMSSIAATYIYLNFL